jgi:hypothetical protein
LTSQVISWSAVVLGDEDAAVPVLGVGAISSGSAVALRGGEDAVKVWSSWAAASSWHLSPALSRRGDVDGGVGAA